MISTDYVKLMSAYTRWQNNSLYAAASTLTDADRQLDRGVFFGSITATLNHLLWGDQLWLHRLAGTPEPKSPDIPGSTQQFASWQDLQMARSATDDQFSEWAERVTERELEGEMSWYSGAMQRDITRPKWALVIQLFNHGTHHRGQVHAMLTAAGARPDDTDVPFMPEAYYDWS